MKRRRTASSVLWVALVWASSVTAQERVPECDWGKRERVVASEIAHIETVTCPACAKACERLTYASVVEYKRDTDFKVVEANVNAYPFVILTCPACSFSTYSAQFRKELTAEQKEAVQTALKGVARRFEDSWAVPLSHSVRAAVATSKALSQGEGTLFEIYLLGSYLARDASELAAEREMQRHAVEHLMAAIEKDEDYRNERMRYLVGELYRRLGQPKDALEWFGKARLEATQDFLPVIARQEQLAREAKDAKPK